MKSLYLSFYAELWSVDLINSSISLVSYPSGNYKFNLVKNTDLDVQPEFIYYCLNELEVGCSYNITVELNYGYGDNEGSKASCIMLKNLVLNYESFNSLVEFFEFINGQASIRFTSVSFSSEVINNEEGMFCIDLDFRGPGFENDAPKNFDLIENFDGLIIG
jgi:hypothetical protein